MMNPVVSNAVSLYNSYNTLLPNLLSSDKLKQDDWMILDVVLTQG